MYVGGYFGLTPMIACSSELQGAPHHPDHAPPPPHLWIFTVSHPYPSTPTFTLSGKCTRQHHHLVHVHHRPHRYEWTAVHLLLTQQRSLVDRPRHCKDWG